MGSISAADRAMGSQAQESVPIDDRNLRTMEGRPMSVHIRKLMFKSLTPTSYLDKNGHEMEINVYVSDGGVELMAGCGTLSVATARELIRALHQAIWKAEEMIS
jgi:hypothetical protein